MSDSTNFFNNKGLLSSGFWALSHEMHCEEKSSSSLSGGDFGMGTLLVGGQVSRE